MGGGDRENDREGQRTAENDRKRQKTTENDREVPLNSI
jgi:hypothetical protein